MKRYGPPPELASLTCLVELSDGQWARFSDVEALEAEVERAIKIGVDAAVALAADNARLRAALERIEHKAHDTWIRDVAREALAVRP